MEYNIKQKISNTVFNTARLTEDDLIRETLFGVIKELPIDVLKEIFNIEFIHGNIDELKEDSVRYNMDRYELVNKLIMENCSVILGKIEVVT